MCTQYTVRGSTFLLETPPPDEAVLNNEIGNTDEFRQSLKHAHKKINKTMKNIQG